MNKYKTKKKRHRFDKNKGVRICKRCGVVYRKERVDEECKPKELILVGQ
jgi:hypothetical protein